MKLLGTVALLVCTLAFSGCKPPDRRLQVFPVTGKVLVNGQPAAQAEITLHPVPPRKDEMGRVLYPHARAGDDGTFQITTYVPGDGAPAGDYRATVTWRTITVQAGEEVYGNDRLQGRFGSPDTGRAVKVEPRENVLDPIDLR